MPLIHRVLPLSVIVVVSAGVGACVPPPGGGGFYESEGPRQVYVPVRRDDGRRDDDRRFDDRRYDDRRFDERRYDDRRRDETVGRQREQDNASRQQQYNSHVRDIQTQHNQRISSLQQQFNQGRINRGQLEAGYRDAERDLNQRIGDEQRALPR